MTFASEHFWTIWIRSLLYIIRPHAFNWRSTICLKKLHFTSVCTISFDMLLDALKMNSIKTMRYDNRCHMSVEWANNVVWEWQQTTILLTEFRQRENTSSTLSHIFFRNPNERGVASKLLSSREAEPLLFSISPSSRSTGFQSKTKRKEVELLRFHFSLDPDPESELLKD